MKKIGILAGTFDPVHYGHLTFAKEAIAQTGLDKVYFLVEPTPRRKQAVKALEHRIAMVKLAIANGSKLGLLVIKHEQYSVDGTLPILLERFSGSKLYMLLGEDVLSHLIDWPNVNNLLSATNFIIGARKNQKTEVEEKLNTIQKTRHAKFAYKIVDTHSFNISSSSVKTKLRAGQKTKDIPPAVASYIIKNKLYASSSK